MDTRDFLSRVLGTEGFYCVFAVNGTSKKQKFFTTLDQVSHCARQFDENGYDAYFALATFSADTNRTAENARQFRAFFLDLDCGEEKDYATQADAVIATKKFVRDTGLPRPYIVNSGRGIHLYWPLSEPIPASEWKPLALRLKALCVDKGFRADPNVTADAARVLRVPGTRNHKDDPPKPVEVLGVSDTDAVVLDRFVSALPEAPASSIFSKPPVDLSMFDAATQRMMGNKASSFRQIVERTASGNGCAQIAFALQHRADLSEPMWRGALSIAKFCSDGAKAIQIVSKGHPEYYPEAAQAKANLIKGPYRCDTFDAENPGVCSECPFRGKITSPIVLGSYIREAGEQEETGAGSDSDEVSEPLTSSGKIYCPKPYKIGVNGGVYKETKDEEGTSVTVQIFVHTLYVTRRVRDPVDGESTVWKLVLPRDGEIEFTVPLVNVTSREEFRKALSTRGVAMSSKELDGLMEYARVWVNELQELTSADDAHRQFGWTDYEDYPSFVVGDQIVYADRVEKVPPSSATIGYNHMFERRGTLEMWKNMMEFYNRPGMEAHQFIIGLCAGSPAMAFLPIHGGIFNLFSGESGHGKTTTCEAGLSIWGSPAELISHEKDTLNSRLNRAELFCNLPMVMDELTNTMPDKLSDLAYGISQGKQRNRMQAGNNQERWRGRPWHTVFITTANCNLLDKVASIKAEPKAEAQRMMEYEFHEVIFGSKSETDEFSHKVRRSYGHVGVPLLRLYAKDPVKTEAMLKKLQREIDEAANFTAKNRFYSATVAVGLFGLIALKKLGVVGDGFDVEAVRKWALEELIPFNLGMVDSLKASASSTLNNFVNDHFNQILRIKSTDKDAELSGGMEKLMVPDRQPGIKLVARYETDTENLYIVPRALKKWCAENQLSYHSLTKQLQSEYSATLKRVRLNRGTRFNMPPMDAWELKFKIPNA